MAVHTHLLRRGLIFAVFLSTLATVAVADDKPDTLTVETVKDLQTKFKAEREAAVAKGVVAKFPADVLAPADKAAKRGEAALAANRLLEANDAFREARWLLPSLPADFPENVARIFGTSRLRHAGWIDDLAFSTDGSRLVTSSRDGSVKVWDVATGTEMRSYHASPEQVAAITQKDDSATVGKVAPVALSSDGKTVALAFGNAAVFWDADTGREIRTQTLHGEPITSLAFSPDGKQLVSCGLDKNVRLWEVESGKQLQDLGNNSKVRSVAFSPDGQQIAAIGDDGIGRIWNATNGSIRLGTHFHNEGGKTGGLQIVFSPDSKTLASCGVAGVPRTTVAPTAAGDVGDAAGKPLSTFAGHTGTVNTVAFSKDGKLLATGGKDHTVRVWDAASGVSVRTFHGHSEEVTGVAFSPDGRMLASVSADHSIRFWGLETVEHFHNLAGHVGSVRSASLSPDGLKAISGSADRTLKLWDLTQDKLIKSVDAHTRPLTVALFSPDGKMVLSCGGDEVAKIWDAETFADPKVLTGHKYAVMAGAFDRDSKRIATGAADRLVKIWDTTGKELQTLTGHSGIVSAVAFAPDGKRLASASADGVLKIWDLATNKTVASFQAHGLGVSALAYSPDGNFLASSGGDQLVKIWNLATDKEPTLFRKLEGHTAPVSSVAWSDDGRFIASAGGDRVIKLWDGHTGAELRGFRGHTDWISSVAFSKDGRSLVSASVDRTVKVWENSSREITLPSVGHQRRVRSVAISPDGNWLASGSDDRTVRLWDLNTGAEKSVMLGHSAPVTTLAFSPDNKVLASATSDDADGTIKFWDVATGKANGSWPGIGLVPAMGYTADGKHLVAWVPVLPPPGQPTVTNVRMFDVTNGKATQTHTDRDRRVNSLALSLDTEIVALGAEDGSVRAVRRDKGERIWGGDLRAHAGRLADLIFTPDKKTLLTASENGEVKVWDVEKVKGGGQDEPAQKFKAHEGGFGSFAMSPKGDWFATTGADQTVKVWETATGKELRRWDVRQQVQSLASTPDGKKLAVANADGTIYLVTLP
jgi:WD40 repeat protein